VPGNLPKRSKTYCACSATHSLNVSLWTGAADRIFPDSFQGPGVSGWNGPPGAELALAHRFDRRPHFAKMRRAIALHHARESRGIGVGPTLIGVEAEAEARHSWVAAGAQDAEGVDASKHPAAQSHRLQHQHPGVATGGEFGGGLG
jgi:hypothetical protein